MPNDIQNSISQSTEDQLNLQNTKITGPSSLEFNENVKPTIDILQKTLTDLQEKHNKLNEDLLNTKKDFLTIFGLFASFITFLGVEIQIFKIITDFWLLIGLSSFLLGGILFFASALCHTADNKSETKTLWSSPGIFFIGLSIFFFLIYTLQSIEHIEANNKACTTKNTIETTLKT